MGIQKEVKARGRIAVLTVGYLVQVQVKGVRFDLTSTEAWDLGAMLCDAAAEADDQPPIPWDKIPRAADLKPLVKGGG